MGVSRNGGLLVGVTCWCPAHAEARAESAIACLRRLLEQAAPAGDARFDVVIIDNDVEHAGLRLEIDAAERRPGVAVVRHKPQRGWAGARNSQMGLFQRGGWSHLAMCDQDVYVEHGAWLTDAEKAAQAEELDAFMLVSVMSDLQGVMTLRRGRLAWIVREFLGGVHVVSRRAIETVGGYNVTDFPQPWGFHDCEYGLRLRAAGLLEASQGHYIDPVMRGLVHADSTPEDPQHAGMKQSIVAEHYPTFQRRVVEINLGQRLFHPLGALS